MYRWSRTGKVYRVVGKCDFWSFFCLSFFSKWISVENNVFHAHYKILLRESKMGEWIVLTTVWWAQHTCTWSVWQSRHPINAIIVTYENVLDSMWKMNFLVLFNYFLVPRLLQTFCLVCKHLVRINPFELYFFWFSHKHIHRKRKINEYATSNPWL